MFALVVKTLYPILEGQGASPTCAPAMHSWGATHIGDPA